MVGSVWVSLLEMAAMRELLEGLPKLPSSSRPSSTAIADLEGAHVELREDLEKEKKKRRSQDRLFVHTCKGVK
ncbi:hypothetical protein HAX54_037833, partial [Datura stramonium]|nr:hypothetical protein [Datura stramonium]